MRQRGPFLFLVALLLLIGLGTATFRHNAYRIPLLPGTQQTVWQVEARVEFLAEGGSTQVLLTLPPEQTGFRSINESSASSGFGFELSTQGQQHRAHWTKRNATGEQVLYYKLELVKDDGFQVPAEEPGSTPSRAWDEPYLTAALQVLQAAIPESADERSLAQQLTRQMNRARIDQNLSLLLEEYSEPELLFDLLNTAGAAARPVQVLELEDGRRRQSLQEFV